MDWLICGYYSISSSALIKCCIFLDAYVEFENYTDPTAYDISKNQFCKASSDSIFPKECSLPK